MDQLLINIEYKSQGDNYLSMNINRPNQRDLLSESQFEFNCDYLTISNKERSKMEHGVYEVINRSLFEFI